MLNKVIPLGLLVVLSLIAGRELIGSDTGETRTEVFPSSTVPEEESTIPGTSTVDLPDVTLVDFNSRATALGGTRTEPGSTTSASTTSSSTSSSTTTSTPKTSSTSSSATTSSTRVTLTLPTITITLPSTEPTTETSPPSTVETTRRPPTTRPSTTQSTAVPPPDVANN